jgi:hypothetical protein
MHYSWSTLRKPPHTDAKRDLKGRTLDPDAKWLFEQLLAGTLGDVGYWPEAVPCQQLYAAYLKDAQALRTARIQVPNEFGATILRFIPEIRRRRLTVDKGRTWCYTLPTLEECRTSFETVMKSKFDWPVEDDGVRIPTAPPEDLPF